MTATITTTDLAADFDTTPRTLRKFLRAEGKGVGKGARYALPATKREVTALRKKFDAWSIAQDDARKAREDAVNAAAPAIDEAPDAPEGDALDALADPTDEDLAAIED